MAAKSKLTADNVAEARRNIRRGSTKTAEAARLGVSPRALSFAFVRYPDDVITRAAPAPPDGPDVDETEDPTEAAELGVSDDMSAAEQRATVVNQLRQAERARDELLASGDLAESRRFAELALKASSVLARLSRLDAVGMISFPSSELDTLKAQARAKFDAMCNAHEAIVCARCRVEIATEWAANPLAAITPAESDQA